MACRTIEEVGDGLVRKIVTIEREIEYPSLNDFLNDPIVLDECKRQYKLNNHEYNMLLQQYNEYYIWNSASSAQKQFLAPIVGMEEVSPPILYYPKFTPLADNDEVWHLNDDESLVLLGARTALYNIPFSDVKNLLEMAHDLEDEFDLVKEDIIYNPSNIGYSDDYGLRIIDYGLVNI